MPEIRFRKHRIYDASGRLIEERDEPYEVDNEELIEEDLWRRLRSAIAANQTRRALGLMYRILRRHLSVDGDDPELDPDKRMA